MCSCSVPGGATVRDLATLILELAGRVGRIESSGQLGQLGGDPLDAGDGLEGHGFVFTIGRGNDVQRAAIEALPELSRRGGGEGAAVLAGASPRADLRRQL